MVEIIVFRLVKHYLIRTDDLLWLNKVNQCNLSSPLHVKLVYFPVSLICQILLAQKKFQRLADIHKSIILIFVRSTVHVFQCKEFS